jgi:spore germination protein KC
MRLWYIMLLILLNVAVLTGCWSKYELTERGFVQAVAIDTNAEGKVELVTHFYKPSGTTSGIGEKSSTATSINIRTQGNSVFDAVRDISIHLGRKAQWSHMRTILIGEETARKGHVGKLLDFFARDHEPRGTISVAVTKGNARDYLDIKPLIESTIGQQLRKIQETASRFTAKTTTTSLLELNTQLESETHTATIPYVYLADRNPKTTVVAGTAILKNDKLVDYLLKPSDTEDYLLLMNKYKNGIIDIPCSDDENSNKTAMISESFEIRKAITVMTPTFKNDSIQIQYAADLSGSIGEFHCSNVITAAAEHEFEQKINKVLEKKLHNTVQILQKQKVDILGIGNMVARKQPQLWKKIKADWESYFAEIPIHIQVNSHITGIGMKSDLPDPE